MADCGSIDEAQWRGRAMGSAVHLIAVGPLDRADAAIRGAIETIEELEQRWSRFISSSDISRLNRTTTAEPVSVESTTIELVDRAVDGWHRTGGLFDPTMLRAIISAGYDRSFDELDGVPESVVELPHELDTGCNGIVIDYKESKVGLPHGIGLDPGGLGKGLAADLICDAAIEQGIDGFLANLGGDIRMIGSPPRRSGQAWPIAIPGAMADTDDVVRLGGGGVATSTCLRRRWSTPAGSAHHLLDPRTRKPAERAARAVTVMAGTACDAEILATAIASHGGLPENTAMLGDAVVVVTAHDGRRSTFGPLERYLRP